ncbi:Zinc finger RING-type protein [Macrophomina phaseolina MS6]|uniref:Zinc finger RING-type protein n=1 Tax=Macrophomina phaseolina (strain MS6) TaxID=1126212 RepID=K2RIV5_MACPH|nr:Zinc finger RING-type protein [Macrophomina phaseolina MS6]
MSGYEVEHNISAEESSSSQSRRRPDLSTFYSALEQLDTSDAAHARHNPHAIPTPADVISLFSMFRDALVVMSPDNASNSNPMLEQIQAMIENPPKEINGVPDSFLDELERVPKKDLKKDDECAICRVPFLDDPYPLVVELPCNANHRFDLDCIRPWLKLNSTCPLDRKDLLKKKTPPPPPDEEEEEYDDMFG